jgi:hypothetical protein
VPTTAGTFSSCPSLCGSPSPAWRPTHVTAPATA